MARISTYVSDTTVESTDKFLGSNAGGTTKNFQVSDISKHLRATNSGGVGGQLVYIYHDSSFNGTGIRQPGTITFDSGGGSTVAFSGITTIKISKFPNTADNSVVNLINTFLNKNIIIADTEDQDQFGVYEVTAIAQDSDENNFYDLSVTLIGSLSNGNLNNLKSYSISATTVGLSGDITSVTAGAGLTGGGTTQAVTLNIGAGNLIDVQADQVDVDLSELTDMTQSWVTGEDEFVVLDNGSQKRKLSSEIFGSNAFTSTTIGTNTNALTVDDSSIQLNSGTTFDGSAARTISVKASGITNAMLAGSIANDKLAGSISNDKLAGSIANDKLANSSVSYGGITLSLGSVDDTPAFNLQDATGYPTSSLTGTITNSQLTGQIANSKLVNSSITINGSAISLGGSVTTPDTNTFRTVKVDTNNDGSANETIGSSEELQLIGGTNITLTESAGVVTINAGASTTVGKTNSTQRAGTIELIAGSNVTITEDGTTGHFTFASTAQLSTEEIQDIAGPLVASGGTKTGVTITYQDSTNDIDFVVSDTTVAGDSGSTGITPGDTLTIAGGTNVTTAMSGDTLTISSSQTLSTEEVQDIVGAMFTGNTETRIAATYEDGDGTIDLVVDDMTANNDVSNANLLTRLAALESSGGSGDENIVIGTDSGDTIVITGNLQVSGTTTTVNSTTVSLNDHNIVLDSGNSTSAVVNGAGITLEGGSGDDATFTYNTTGPKFELKLGSNHEDLQVDQLIAGSISVSGGFKDSSGDLGTNGQLLSSTGSGTNWVSGDSANSVIKLKNFTGNGSTTAFTLDHTPTHENTTQVYINGVYQLKSTYSTSGTTLTFSEAPPNLSNVEVISFTVLNNSGGAISASSLDISGDVDIDGTLETDALSINGTAITASAADINLIDGITNGTVIASKAIITDSNKDITGGRNITISGELDAATLDISGDADIDGTLEADAITVNGTALNTVIAGVTVTNATNSSHVLVTDNESTSENNLITFVEGATSSTGNVGLEMDGNLTYNPSTGTVTATAFSGNLTGNVTGNTSGTAATVTGAAQSNITSLGTLTTLTVDNVIINGTTIGHTSATNAMTIASGGEVEFTGANHISGASSLRAQAKSGNLYLDTSASALIRTNGTTTALTLDASQNATFAGSINTSGNLEISNGSPDIFFHTTGNHYNWMIGVQENVSTAFEISVDGATGTGSDTTAGNYTPVITALANGKVGIGTTSPGSYDGESDDLVVASGVDGSVPTPGITIACLGDTKATGRGALRFSDGTSSTQMYMGGVEYNHNGDAMSFRTAGVQRVTIASTGETTITASDVTGLKIAQTGQSYYHVIRNQGDGLFIGVDDDDSGGAGADLRINVSGSEKMRLSNGGNLGIGDSAFNYYANRLVVKAPDEDGVTFLSGSGEKFWLCFADGTSGHAQELAGHISFDHGDNTMKLGGNAGYDWITLGSSGDITFANTSGNRFVSYSDNQTYLSNQSAWNSGNANKLIFEGRYRSTANDTTSLGEIHVGRDETSTDGHYGGNMSFWTRLHGGAITERMRINDDGILTIARSAIAVGSAGYRFDTNGEMYTSIANNLASYYLYDTTNGAWRFYVTGAGQIVAQSTSINSLSDISLKENIKPLETGLDEVIKLQPRRFDWKNDDGKNIAGFVAQEVEEILPDLVSEQKYNETENKKFLKMGDMIPTLVKAIQEQQTIIEDLKSRIQTLEG